MIIQLSDEELTSLADTIDDCNCPEVTNVFLAIFGKKHIPEFDVNRTREGITVRIPEHMTMTFIKVLQAHAVTLGTGIKKRSVFNLLNDLKHMGSDLGRVFKRG